MLLLEYVIIELHLISCNVVGVFLDIFARLQDKWRNMSTSSATAQLSTPQASSSDTVALDATSTPAVDDSSKGSSDGKTSPTYDITLLLS